MTFRAKLLTIAILPIIIVSALIAAVIYVQAERLAKAELALVENRVIASKRQEIENYISLALTSVGHIYDQEPGGRATAQSEVKRILHDMTFGPDGYFFVYSEDGTNLVHPKLPELVGKNWWDLQDPNGDYVIRNLIDKAKAGGDFHRYVWNKPSSGAYAEKLGYATFLPKWGWMFGTGLYIDDIAEEVAQMRDKIEGNIHETTIVLIGLTLFAVTLIAAVLLAVSLSEQRLADTKLKELTKRIVNVQEEERKRVSTELHDGISQYLISVRYTLDLAHAKSEADPELQSLIGKSMAVLNTTIGEIRRISKDLRPSVLDDMGLAAAIAGLGKDFEERTGITVDVAAEREGCQLPEGARTALYRVVQEALTNVAKHSGADHVDIRIMSEPRRGLNLSIVDNGAGFALKRDEKNGHPVADGFGIRNMRERVESCGGRFAIRSRGRSGTEITVTVPPQKTAVAAETRVRA